MKRVSKFIKFCEICGVVSTRWHHLKHKSLETLLKMSLNSKGRIPWNKGLNKRIDDRIRKQGESSSKTKQGHPRAARNKGLNKEDPRVRKYLENGKEKRSKTCSSPKYREKQRENALRVYSEKPEVKDRIREKRKLQVITEESNKKRSKTLKLMYKEKGGMPEEQKRNVGLGNKGKRRPGFRNSGTFKLGMAPWNKDLTRGTDERVRKYGIKISKKWKDVVWKEAVLDKIYKANNFTPNKAEVKLDDYFKSWFPNLIGDFSGNGKKFVVGRCPDWVTTNGKKQVIELFGNYFHSEKVTGRIREQEEKERIDHFKKYGWDCLVILESELKDLQTLKLKVQNFLNKEV